MADRKQTPHLTRTAHLKRKLALSVAGSTFVFFPLQNCNLGEFTATSTVTLDGRQVITTLVNNAILGPIETAVATGVDRFFDWLEGIGDDEE